MRKWLQYASLALSCGAALLMVGLQNRPTGFLLLLLSVLTGATAGREFFRHSLLINIALLILGIAPISTDISYGHFLTMGPLLTLAVAAPYWISRYYYKERIISFPLSHWRHWTKNEIGYLLLALVVAYFLLPFYLSNTDSYQNWVVPLDTSSLIRLFIGTNVLGAWDELFFICTILTIMRQHLPFWWANLAQATIFTSFLYELGFRGWWGPIMIFIFALIQGYVFKRTHSLGYILSVHLTVDLVLYLALIYEYYPHKLPIFVT